MRRPPPQLRDEELQRRALTEEPPEGVDGTWEEAWLAEARRRSTEGYDDAKPWSEVKVEIMRRLGK
ncbi:MAG: hypothetical protein ACOZNI_26605 [Myxococcota bacterium]